MTRLLSYLYPVTKKITSLHNGILELTWYNGKKMLNSKNANYSYGSLQKILKFGLKKIDLKKVDSILILGMGAGSVIETLREDFDYQNQITAVDIDPVIIEIAHDEFGIVPSDTLDIICDDALNFLKNTTTTFHLIIIDLYIDLLVPNPFVQLSFWELVTNANAKHGHILFNASVNQSNENTLNDIIDFLRRKEYHTQKVEHVEQTNTLLITKHEGSH